MNTNLLPLKRRTDKLAARREYENPVLAIQDEMNRMFDRFFTDPFDLAPFEHAALSEFSPRIDVSETDKEIRVVAELPGLDEKDIQLELEQDALVISGEKKSESEDKGKNFHRVERSFGSFSRVIPLPAAIEAEKVEAEFKKGVLTVTLPKPASAVKAAHKIAIKS
jgi:Molecular chaperone (small heat shock protein)